MSNPSPVRTELLVLAAASPLSKPRFGPRSEYVEYCYLPVLGPTATWLYRRLGMLVILAPQGTRVDTAELAAASGLGLGLGQHSPLVRALTRLIKFDTAAWDAGRLLIRPSLGPISARQLQRLPIGIQTLESEMRAEAIRQG